MLLNFCMARLPILLGCSSSMQDGMKKYGLTQTPFSLVKHTTKLHTKYEKYRSLSMKYFSKNQVEGEKLIERYCMPQTVWTFNLRPKRLKRIGQNFYCAFRYLIWSGQPFETA